MQKQRAGYEERLALLKKNGYPAYTTSVGWFGFSDAKIRRLAVEALAQGWKNFKLKVGGNEADDRDARAGARRDWGRMPVDGRRQPEVGCRRGNP